MKKAFSQLGGSMQSKSDLEKNSLRVKLANAGFRSETAPTFYLGLRLIALGVFAIPAAIACVVLWGFTLDALWKVGLAVRARERGEDMAVSIAVVTPGRDHVERRMAFLGGSLGRTRAALTAAAVLLRVLRDETVPGDPTVR